MAIFANNAKCDIYIGTGAGKKLLEDINNAKKSVKIISPYLSPGLMKEIIYLKNNGIDIELITMDDIEDFYNNNYEKNIHKLIIQKRITDDKAVEKREKYKDIVKILTYIGYGLLAILIIALYYIKDTKVLYGAVPLTVLYFITKLYKDKVKNQRIYNYCYAQLFPFKVFHSHNNNYIHSKIYLIDEKIAYLGSLNLTNNGTKDNHETRIRTEDPIAIEQIKAEIKNLMQSQSGADIQAWGRQLYEEPIN